MLYYLAVALYIIVSLFLIIVVLLQPGKGDGMGAAFGGSSTGSVFGGRGASNVLTKMTTGSAILFMVLSVILARSSADHSVVGEATPPSLPGASAPVNPGESPDEAGSDEGKAAPAAPAAPATPAGGATP